MSKKGRFILFIVALFLLQGAVSKVMFPIWKKNYSAGNVGVTPGLTPDQLLASLSGLRQFVAGLLWVQADEYFDSGQFDAVLPMIRIVTWLDPRQIEVYSTGAWHIAYNFTDDQSRSDRRYIPLALRLVQEGIAQNPDTYRLYHEMGWLYYHKVDDDYEKAVRWFQESVKRPDVLPYLRSILSSAYLKAGRLDDAMKWYWEIEKFAEKKFKETGDEYMRILKDNMSQNLNNLLVRMASRGVFARRDGVYDKMPYDTHNPVDLNFTVKLEMIQPRVMRVTGTWGIPTTGARIRIVLREADYELKWDPAPSLDFDFGKGRTYMQDSLYTLNSRFDRKIDMSRNPTMYPFKAEKYVIEFFYSPRMAPPHIQDKLGWDGEGMTDKRYLRTDIRPGVRCLYARFEVPRDFIEKRGSYKYSAVLKSPGYVDVVTRGEEDVIRRGSLRD